MKYLAQKRRQIARAALRVAAIAVLVGCGGGGDDDEAPVVDTRVKVSMSGFDNQACMQWQTYRAINDTRDVYVGSPLEVRLDGTGDPYAVSTGPWWNDLNHVTNGSNYANLVAIGYYDGWVDPTAVMSALSPGRPIDLRNADITLQWRAPDLLMAPESKLVFWFQTRSFDPQAQQLRYVNYALTGQALKPRAGDTKWQVATLKLTPDPSQWLCLGSSPTRLDTYGCARSIDEALTNFEVDLGFLIISPALPLSDQPTGAVEFKNISVMLPPENIKTHANSASYLYTGRSACIP